MSQAPKKIRTQAALEEAGLSQESLGAALGRDRIYVERALSGWLTPEEAGEMCRVLAEMAGLSAAARREVFRELVNHAGEGDDPLFGRVSSEDPMDEAYDAVRERYGSSYERPPRGSQENS